MCGCVFGCGHWKLWCVPHKLFSAVSVLHTYRHTHAHTHTDSVTGVYFFTVFPSHFLCFEKVFIMNFSELRFNMSLFTCWWFKKIISLDCDKKAFPCSFTILWIKATVLECNHHVSQTHGCHKSIFSERSFIFKLVNVTTLLAAVIWSICV